MDLKGFQRIEKVSDLREALAPGCSSSCRSLYTTASLSFHWQLRIIRIAKEEEIASKSINEVEPLRCKTTPRQLRPGGLPFLSIFLLRLLGFETVAAVSSSS